MYLFCQGSEKLWFFKKLNPLSFFCFIGFWAIGFLGFFYSSEQLGSLLVDLAHQLSFYLIHHSPVLYFSDSLPIGC